MWATEMRDYFSFIWLFLQVLPCKFPDEMLFVFVAIVLESSKTEERCSDHDLKFDEISIKMTRAWTLFFWLNGTGKER